MIEIGGTGGFEMKAGVETKGGVSWGDRGPGEGFGVGQHGGKEAEHGDEPYGAGREQRKRRKYAAKMCRY
eukprot:10435-Hanusia_phi.AAC.3